MHYGYGDMPEQVRQCALCGKDFTTNIRRARYCMKHSIFQERQKLYRILWEHLLEHYPGLAKKVLADVIKERLGK